MRGVQHLSRQLYTRSFPPFSFPALLLCAEPRSRQESVGLELPGTAPAAPCPALLTRAAAERQQNVKNAPSAPRMHVRSCWERPEGSVGHKQVFTPSHRISGSLLQPPSQASTSPCQSHTKFLSAGSRDCELWLVREMAIIKFEEIYGVLERFRHSKK